MYLHVIRETTALFAQADMMALGAIAELKNAGLQVPDDISVIGYNNIEPGVYSRPYLTTVRAKCAAGRRDCLRTAVRGNQ